jgi:hypothetical protein
MVNSAANKKTEDWRLEADADLGQWTMDRAFGVASLRFIEQDARP